MAGERNPCSAIPEIMQKVCAGALFNNASYCDASDNPAVADSTTTRSGQSPLLRSVWACGHPLASTTLWPDSSKIDVTKDRVSACRITLRTSRRGFTRHPQKFVQLQQRKFAPQPNSYKNTRTLWGDSEFSSRLPGRASHSFPSCTKRKKVPTAVVHLKVPQRSAHITMQ